IHSIERGSIGQDGDDRFRLFGKLLWTCRRGGTELYKRLRFLGRAVPHRKPMPDLDEPLRNGSSHLTNAGDAKLHSKSLLCEERDDDRLPVGCVKSPVSARDDRESGGFGWRMRSASLEWGSWAGRSPKILYRPAGASLAS